MRLSSLFVSSFLFVILTIIMIMTSQGAEAFWQLGHELVAEIASLNVDDHVRGLAESTGKYLAAIGPFPDTGTGTLMEISTFPDEIKGYSLKMFDEFHFIDTPIINATNWTYNASLCPVAKVNGATTLDQFFGALKESKYHRRNGFTMAFSLAYATHIIGDLSQPLHASSLFSPEFPEGDRGGNSITVYWQGKKTNLHKIYDSMCSPNKGENRLNDFTRPLNASARAEISAYALKLNQTWNNLTVKECSVYKGMEIAADSYELAKSIVYANLTDGMHLPQWYMDRCKTAMERQVVLGGCRLAHELKYVFGNEATTPSYLKIPEGPTKDIFESLPDGAKTAGIFFAGFFTCLILCALIYWFCLKSSSSSSSSTNYQNVDDHQRSTSSVHRSAMPSSPALPAKEQMNSPYETAAKDNMNDV